MDIHTAGLTHACSPLAAVPVAYRTNEDAYYAAYQFGWTIPTWIAQLAAALGRQVQRPAHEPTAIIATQMA
jgi:hypothetical protein